MRMERSVLPDIVYTDEIGFGERDIEALYRNVGWSAYLKDIPRLMKAFEKSLLVISAWDSNKLIGIIRVVGDGLTILYVQDILVLSEYRRMGVGSNLLRNVTERFSDIRQIVLLTDDNTETRGFYERNGFQSCDKGQLVAFMKSL